MSLSETLVKTTKELQLNFLQKTTATIVAESSQHTVSELCSMIDVCSVQIHTGRTARLTSIKLVYILFAKISTDKKALVELEETFRNLGEWNTSQKLLNALVQKGLGVDRKLASKYAKVIFHALENGIPESAFEHFVKEHGGIEAISRFKSKSETVTPIAPVHSALPTSSVDSNSVSDLPSESPVLPEITKLDSQITAFLRQKIRDSEDRKFPIHVTIDFHINEKGEIFFREHTERPLPSDIHQFLEDYIERSLD